MYKALRIIPDRSVENKKGHEFARALHDLYVPWYKRVNVGERHLEAPERVRYVVRLAPKDITFQVVVSPQAETLVKQRLNRYWPHAAIQETEFVASPVVHTSFAELKYRQHNIFALAADWREDTVPIAALLNVVRDMKPGDEARVLICIEPYNRTAWADWSERAHAEFKTGKTPGRRGACGEIDR